MSFNVALGAFPHKGEVHVKRNEGSVTTVDGGGASGHLVAREAIDLALTRLPDVGVISIGIRNITRFNCPGSIARYAAERGAIALVLEYGGAPFMVSPEGRDPVVSTNPIGIAFPGDAPLFVLDIATSERAIGYVALANSSGENLERPWGVTADGDRTANPKAVKAVLPAAGYKGFGLALAAEVLSGILVGVPVGSQGSLGRRGAWVVLIDPAAHGQDPEEFARALGTLLEEVSSARPVDTSMPPTYPGLRGEERKNIAESRGSIEVPDEVVRKLRELAK